MASTLTGTKAVLCALIIVERVWTSFIKYSHDQLINYLIDPRLNLCLVRFDKLCFLWIDFLFPELFAFTHVLLLFAHFSILCINSNGLLFTP